MSLTPFDLIRPLLCVALCATLCACATTKGGEPSLASPLEPTEPSGPPWEGWTTQEKTALLTPELEGAKAFDHRVVTDMALKEQTWRVLFPVLDTVRIFEGHTERTRQTIDTLMLGFDVSKPEQIVMDVTYLYTQAHEGVMVRVFIPLDRAKNGEHAQLALWLQKAHDALGAGFTKAVMTASADFEQTSQWQVTLEGSVGNLSRGFEEKVVSSKAIGQDTTTVQSVLRSILWDKLTGTAYVEPSWSFESPTLDQTPFPLGSLSATVERPLELIGLKSAFPPKIDDLDNLKLGPGAKK